MTKPISVAIGVIEHDNKILLIKRKKPPMQGFWAFPGGKIEQGEDPHTAACREIAEETGIESEAKESHGIVSERIIEDNETMHHFMLHFVRLQPQHTTINQGSEGDVAWHNVEDLKTINIIPSDIHIFERLIRNKEKDFFESVIEKKENGYEVTKFE